MSMTLAAKFKTAFLIIIVIISYLSKVRPLHGPGVISALFTILTGVIGIPFIIGVNSNFIKWELVKPNWNDKFSLKRPLIFIQFGGYWFLIGGLSNIIGTALRYNQLNTFALEIFSFGIGSLIGIRLILMMKFKTRK